MIPAEILGTIPGWLTSLFSGGALIAILRWQVLNRNASTARFTAEAAADVSVGGILATEVAALRERLDRQATRFREELDAMEQRSREAMAASDRRHEEALSASEKRHQECLADRDGLRGEVSVLRDEINGMVRVITQASIDRVVMLGDVVPTDIKDAAARAQIIIDKEAEKGK